MYIKNANEKKVGKRIIKFKVLKFSKVSAILKVGQYERYFSMIWKKKVICIAL
jgi:hypothetical protein